MLNSALDKRLTLEEEEEGEELLSLFDVELVDEGLSVEEERSPPSRILPIV